MVQKQIMVTLKPEKRARAVKMAEPQPATPAVNPLDSFFDVLNRDQRTIVTICQKSDRTKKGSAEPRSFPRENFSKCRPLIQTHVDSMKISETGSAIGRLFKKIGSRSWGSRRRISPDRTFLDRTSDSLISRLGQVFIVGVCLLTVVRFPSAMAAPSQHPKKPLLGYLDTCGTPSENNIQFGLPSAPRLSDDDIIKHIIIQAKTARDFAKQFKKNYVNKTFKSNQFNIDKHVQHLGENHYKWIPKIPEAQKDDDDESRHSKTKSSDDEPKHLKNKSLDDFLAKSLEYLQKFAAVFELIVADQEKYQGEFYQGFRDTEIHLRHVICEIREGMQERNISFTDQWPESIDGFFTTSIKSSRDVRDWLVYRSLLNCLEYIIQVFTYIQDNLPVLSS